jgi:tetratricopeptide (TPR) repeat protein/Leucine-rich repeat (LRR) protein
MHLHSIKLLTSTIGVFLTIYISLNWIAKDEAGVDSFRQYFSRGDLDDGVKIDLDVESVPIDGVHPQDAEAIRTMADLKALQSDEDQRKLAAALYRNIIKLHPTDTSARLGLGKVLASLEQYEKAENSLFLAVKFFQAKNNMHGVEESRNALGKLYISQGRYNQAEELFRASVLGRQINRDEERNRINWGCAYQGMGELYSALRTSDSYQGSDANTAAPVSPDAKTHFQIALNEYQQGAYRQARTEIDAALLLSDENPYHIFKGFLLLLEKNYPEAEAIFANALKTNKDEIGALAGLGHLGIIRKDYAYARSILDSAHKAAHAFEEANLYESWIHQQILLGLGWVAANQNQHVLALEHFNECLSIAPDDLLALLGKGNSLIGLRRMADAQEVFDRVLELDSTNPYALAELGIIKLERGAVDEAESNLKLALEGGGELFTCPYEGLGLLYLKRGKLDEAKKSFERAIEINPNIEYRKFNELAKLYIKEGKREKAKPLLLKSIENFPYDSEAERLLKELQEDMKSPPKNQALFSDAHSSSTKSVEARTYTIRRFAEVSPTSVLVPLSETNDFIFSEDAYIVDRVLYWNDQPAALDLAGLRAGASLKLINDYPQAATSIRIEMNRICDKEILGSLNNLRAQRIALTIPNLVEGDESLSCLEKLNAQEMYLDLHHMSDAAANGLSSLKSLRTLKIRDMNCTDECLESISELTELKELVLRGTKITDDGLKHLSSLIRLRSLDLWGTKISGRGLAHLRSHSNLRILELGETHLTDEGMRHLAKLENLEELGLISTNISDFGLRHTTTMHNLRRLKLSYTLVTDEGLRTLASLENLRSLDLLYTEVTDDGLQYFSSMKSLKTLNLGGTKVTSRGLAHLVDLPKLDSLILANTQVDDKGFEAIGRMHNLHYIELAHTPINGSGLKHLMNLPRLDWLGLRSTQISDDTISPIASIRELKWLVLSNTNLSDRGISHLKHLPKLRELHLGGTQITDDGLIHMAGLKSLVQLEFQDTQISDDGLRHLAQLINLENLELGGTQVTDRGLKHLLPLANLEEINLGNTRISDHGLETLTHFPKLWYVCLSGTQVSDKGMRILAQMTKLEDLALGYTRISDEGLSTLSKLPALRRLLIWHTDVSDSGLQYLMNISTLEELEMSQTQISDAGIKRLLHLHNLRELEIGGTKITEGGIQKLRQGLPTCVVSHLSYDH